MLRVSSATPAVQQTLQELGKGSDETPLPGKLFTTMDFAIATAVGMAVFGDD